MRRTALVTVLVCSAAVLASPRARRGLAARAESLRTLAQERLASFRVDFTEREAQLRAELLPSENATAEASRRRREQSAGDPAAHLRTTAPQIDEDHAYR